MCDQPDQQEFDVKDRAEGQDKVKWLLMNNNMKRIIICLLSISLTFSIQAQNLLPESWKFMTGDDPAWSAVTFNDSGWKDIIPGAIWEQQGYNSYDGYAWYRVTFNVP